MTDDTSGSIDATLPSWDALDSLEDVLNWTPDDHSTAFCSALEAAEQNPRRRPLTLLCHDMMGGYLEDKFTQGAKTNNCFRFYHWNQIDIFVYFSHCFVSIPPLGWTCAGHKHNVQVLGTFITEWNKGAEICEQFLQTKSAAECLADQLVNIAKHYKFDGWLINIENPLETSQVPMLVHFVAYLTEKVKLSLNRGFVIWYDSVVRSGALQWQNELNMENRKFFDACDGIFLNYTWQGANLDRSRDLAAECSPSNRSIDVFVGVDVFGRGCKGGGGYNTIEAVLEARQRGLSTAIFAPGWVWETQNKQHFLNHQNRFWELLECPKKDILCQCEHFTSTFCQGWGQRYFHEGEVLLKDSWFDLSLQSIQPSLPLPPVNIPPGLTPPASYIPAQKNRASSCSYNTGVGYQGGGSLQIEVNFAELQIVETPIFNSQIIMGSAQTFEISVTYQVSQDSLSMLLKLVIAGEGEPCVFLLQGEAPTKAVLSGSNLQCNIPWIKRKFILDRNKKTPLCIESISLSLNQPTGLTIPKATIYLGEIKILPNPHILTIQQPSQPLSFTKINHNHSLLKWKYPNEAGLKIAHFLLYIRENEHWRGFGCTTASCYTIVDFEMRPEEVSFRVIPVLKSGLKANQDSWAELCNIGL
ncbi:hypothetical protein CAPTEDRAFT_184001 [Capitella teleta]|uniref:Cytosolic endo-beta-N-acetylglucosaminidase n=1 Tax=Capitella teleta TaxID=283909 RepID=R7U1B0_CAPTE|nr:hypothetical protein CAPTEDRAFT_184001 [Capitella teleta]|eukprot:ELT96975.1 hypothetical protein CAPTEDRAFT_184001 [Capitella teleta]